VRSLCYVTGTRADFGLMRRTLETIAGAAQLKLGLIVTGMHLCAEFGNTVREIEETGLPIRARVALSMADGSGAGMARGIAAAIDGFVGVLEQARPDALLLLGDRGEMLAGAIAAIHLNVPIVHLHGGERSGTVDEPVRHAISKLSHYHLVATEQSRTRLQHMGEVAERIHVVGAPGLDGLLDQKRLSRAELCQAVGFDAGRLIALFVFHPVMQSADRAGDEARILLDAVAAADLQTIAVLPNADAGNHAIREAILRRAVPNRLVAFAHLSRDTFISWMSAADVMIGNSSSGIIEAASFGTPVVNAGSRQSLRERNSNVIDCDIEPDALTKAIRSALAHGRYSGDNVYGDGHAAERICAFLQSMPLDGSLLFKANTY
jgi:GDP/UDP-N,N'-diacetylbacillosamine 2-epimerase (hydrolysing)